MRIRASFLLRPYFFSAPLSGGAEKFWDEEGENGLAVGIGNGSIGTVSFAAGQRSGMGAEAAWIVRRDSDKRPMKWL